jgi:phage terminase large subunit GpA-like protein
MAKEELYRWLRLDRPTDERLDAGETFPPGFCHFPHYSEEYFKQLVAEQLVTKVVKGYRKTEWQKMRERNEALDARVYARAAAAVAGMDRWLEEQWEELEARVAEPETAPEDPAGQSAPPATSNTAAPTRRVRRSSWLNR